MNSHRTPNIQAVKCVKELHEAGYSVSGICDILELNRSGYYKWTKRVKSRTEEENELLLHDIGVIYAEHNGTYGYRCIADEYNATHEKKLWKRSFTTITIRAASIGWIAYLRQLIEV